MDLIHTIETRFCSGQPRSVPKSWQRNSPMQGRMDIVGLLRSVCVIIFKKASELTARYYTDPQEVVDAWMSRASTKAKIISKRYNEIGVGVYLDEDGFLYYAVIVAVRK